MSHRREFNNSFLFSSLRHPFPYKDGILPDKAESATPVHGPVCTTIGLMGGPKTWVVLIGIGFYKNDRNLDGAVNDVANVKLCLVRSGRKSMNLSAFTATPPPDPTAMKPTELAESAWPTYENITSKLNQIIHESSLGDYVYIQDSGHGSRQPTTSSAYSEQNSSVIALVLFNPSEDKVDGKDKGVRYLRGLDLGGY